MSTATGPVTRPVEIAAAAGALAPAGLAGSKATARVCAVIVTWNRKGFVSTVLRALARQTYPLGLIDVVVVDNAGTDGTLDHLAADLRPERIVDNDTEAAHEPRFAPPRDRTWAAPDAKNTLGLSSLTVVRNRANMGGCGGFNTGFAYVEHAFRAPPGSPAATPDFVWLVDDDVDLPDDVLEHLVRAMESDPGVGLVGSRTCDINDRARTIETTIYFNRRTGAMQDDAPPGHPRHAAHRAWVQRVGGPRGTGGEAGYHGLMDVDVVSACSMLARWSAVVGAPAPAPDADPAPTHAGNGTPNGAAHPPAPARPPVGFWDHRYFIYCDDADWCLRFARRGWRVVLNLDAVVFHTPWNLKLTPARIYYANRNRLWMIQKALPVGDLRRVTADVMRSILFDALHAALHRRRFHARIILDTGLHAARDVGGKTGSDGPPPVPALRALELAGCLTGGRTVAVVCNTPDSLAWLDELRAAVRRELADPNAKPPVDSPVRAEPRWLPIVRNDVAGPTPPPGAVVYGRHLGSRLKKQLWMLKERPHAVVVFDQINDFPVLLGAPWTLHIDHKRPAQAQLERDGWFAGPPAPGAPDAAAGEGRLAFLWRWLKARRELRAYAAHVEPYESRTRYG